MRTPWLLVAVVLLAGCTSSDDGGDDGTGGGAPGDGLADVPGTVTWGGADAPLRPGASLGGYCTFNFLFTGSGGTAYVGTAGHCTQALGEEPELDGEGPVGKVVFDSDETEGADAAVDFSLIELDAAWVAKANPRVFGHDGPTGVVDSDGLAVGDSVYVYGYGVGVGATEPTRPRQGVLVGWDDKLYQADMPAVNGDSGAPLLHADTGQALGIISHYGFEAVPPTTDEGPLMPFILAELAKAGFDVRLALP